jgi:hypothetical protein
MTSIIEQNPLAALAVPISDLPDEQLLLHRELLVLRRKQVLDEISAALSQAEAEIQARIERNGGRSLLAHEEGIIVKAETIDNYTPWVYDIDGLRDVAKMLPEKEAAKIVKFVDTQTTVIEAHYEPGNSRSIEALINQYGEQSEVGKKLAACRDRSYLGKKLKISAEGSR